MHNEAIPTFYSSRSTKWAKHGAHFENNEKSSEHFSTQSTRKGSLGGHNIKAVSK